MTVSPLPLPAEPHALRALVRTVLEQTPETALPLVVAGEWIADPLWQGWRELLEPRGMDRQQFGGIVAGYGNELRLWVVGERPWNQYASGIAGRVTRRIPEAVPETADDDARWSEGEHSWRHALRRVGVTPEHGLPALTSRITDLHLLYDISAPNGNGAVTTTAIVWAGGRPRDPEAPVGEGRARTVDGALAEALGRFLVRDPAYPPR